MKRWSVLLLVAVVLLGSGAAVAVVAQGGKSPARVSRVHEYWKHGPSATYDGDSGGIAGVEPLRVRVPDGEWTVVVSVSFQYRTQGPGPFQVDVGMREAGGPRVDLVPGQFALAKAPDGGTASPRFLARRVEGPATYEVGPGVNAVFTDGRNVITSGKMLMTVELTRAG